MNSFTAVLLFQAACVFAIRGDVTGSRAPIINETVQECPPGTIDCGLKTVDALARWGDFIDYDVKWYLHSSDFRTIGSFFYVMAMNPVRKDKDDPYSEFHKPGPFTSLKHRLDRGVLEQFTDNFVLRYRREKIEDLDISLSDLGMNSRWPGTTTIEVFPNDDVGGSDDLPFIHLEFGGYGNDIVRDLKDSLLLFLTEYGVLRQATRPSRRSRFVQEISTNQINTV
jgi:hypothetical protein